MKKWVSKLKNLKKTYFIKNERKVISHVKFHKEHWMPECIGITYFIDSGTKQISNKDKDRIMFSLS